MLRARLFVISYVPLLWIVALQHWPQGPTSWRSWLPVGSVILVSFVGIFDALHLTRSASSVGALAVHIRNITDEGANAAAYLVTYLLPFVSVSLTDWNSWAAYGVFFVVLFVIFVRSSFGLVNPTMYLLGWRVVQADLVSDEWGGHTRRATVLVKEVPAPGSVRLRKMAGGYRLER